jgi:hypothetical protein
MPLTIKKSNWDPSTSLSNASPLQKSLWAKFSVYNNTEDDWYPLKSALLNKEYSIILSEPIELQIETDWTETGGAEISKKVNQIFNPKAIRALAGENANAHAPNDEWTQKTTEMGKPLSTKLKFRIYDSSYDEPNNKNQSYIEMIQFLTIVCAPRKRYSLTTNVLDPLINAAQKSKEFFNDLKKASSSKTENEETGVLNNIVSGVNAVSATIKNQLLSMTRYNYTIRLDSNILKSEMITVNEGEELHPDWYIKSFNWMPSTEMIFKDSAPFPLWVDFDIDVETCIVWPKELFNKNVK